MVFEREQAAFEAGIKLGALYHQFIGTPVSPETAPKLEEAIERSIGLQPYVRQVRVRLDRGGMQENIFGYSELSGTMLSVDLVTRVHYELTNRVIALETPLPDGKGSGGRGSGGGGVPLAS
jgi:hypothetical protein